MPKLSKKALSEYLNTECQRQLKFILYSNKEEKERLGIPPKQPPISGLVILSQAGKQWERQKAADLAITFGQVRENVIIGTPKAKKNGLIEYDAIPLEQALITAHSDQFMIEPEYEIPGLFKRNFNIKIYALKHDLRYARIRPDIIQVCRPGTHDECINPLGNVERIAKDDERIQLRVIDIKLTANPTKSYLSEVAFYMMVLANWLKEKGLDKRFIVINKGAIWFGTHEASHLIKMKRRLRKEGQPITYRILEEAFEDDLELIPYEVMSHRIRSFLSQDLSKVLSTPWEELDWHVSPRCQRCDYAGFSYRNKEGVHTRHRLHCIPTAKQERRLSRVAGMSRGARNSLRESGIVTIDDLSTLESQNDVFDQHQLLREMRAIMPHRARSIIERISNIPPHIGRSSMMPNWQDLAIYLSINFDDGSDVSLAYGVEAFWIRPTRENTEKEENNPPYERFRPKVFIVDTKDIEAEKRELFNFLNHVYSILRACAERDPATTVQVYFWSENEYQHLCKLIGRHLDEILINGTIKNLTWLFPPLEIMPNEELMRRSYITIVQNIIRSMLVLPTSFYYSILKTAKHWHYKKADAEKEPTFHIHPLFKYDLNDKIPSERAHEIWSRISTEKIHWLERLKELEKTIHVKLRALRSIALNTQITLRQRGALRLRSPRINIRPPALKRGLALDSTLWYHFAKLNFTVDYLENRDILSLPPHVREAKNYSARLLNQVQNKRERNLILNKHDLNPYDTYYLIYRMSPGSREVKIRENEFNLVLSPEADQNFLDRRLFSLVRETPQEQYYRSQYENELYMTMENITKVTLVKIDREELIMILKPDEWRSDLFSDLLRDNLINLNENVILDSIKVDFFTDQKLLPCLRAIGNPEIARSSDLVRIAFGITQREPRSRTSSHILPVSRLLWSPQDLYSAPTGRNTDAVKAILIKKGFNLNPSQWEAWEEALSYRLRLIWGPPGTGKSLTLEMIIIGALMHAKISNEPVRILITSFTYRAIDNVLFNIHGKLKNRFPNVPFTMFRLRSHSRSPPPLPKEIRDIIPHDSRIIKDLMEYLEEKKRPVIVSGTPSQVFNLLRNTRGGLARSLFDLIMVDEASQLDVSRAILPLCSLSEGGSAIFTGDLLQLPPIHAAVPPLDLESMVGSIYDYLKSCKNISEHMLSINYRSNATIVNFSHNAGYQLYLRSHSPQLKLNFLDGIQDGSTRPNNWPIELYWTPEWSRFLDPAYPMTCFVYPDAKNSQWNEFEAQAVVSIVWLLRKRMCKPLLDEKEPDGNMKESNDKELMSSTEFWERGIGIVTPHRAQQALIISELKKRFSTEDSPHYMDPHEIRNAVDTVERFQGQQRDVIIASFALGDPDMIRNEEDFLTNLNRFNVMSSRPRAKYILFISEDLVNYLSSNIDILSQSRLLKNYVEVYCNEKSTMELGYVDDGEQRQVRGTFKARSLE